MRISVFGLGYVGIVSAGCLLNDGHEVVGVDLIESKVSDVGQGISPISEPQVSELLSQGYAEGRLTATSDVSSALEDCDLVWICVGTPSGYDGSIDLSAVKSAVGQIGAHMRNSDDRPTIVLRSTALPGCTEEIMIPELEAKSGLKAGVDFQVLFHPEFLREGTAVEDFREPPKIVIGEYTPGAGKILESLYPPKYVAPRFTISLKEAELVKYYDNLFHAVKVTFANELGSLAKSLDIDGRKVAEVFCADTKLNISSKYLKPGFAFGGSCLPKDLRAINRQAELSAVNLPMLESVLISNAGQIRAFVRRVLEPIPKSVGIVGLAFKQDTDDMRESPNVAVAKQLLGEGCDVLVFDNGVNPDRLTGSNLEAVRRSLRHLETLLVSSVDELDDCDTIIINHRTVSAERVLNWCKAGKRVIDVVGIDGVDRHTPGYEGMAW